MKRMLFFHVLSLAVIGGFLVSGSAFAQSATGWDLGYINVQDSGVPDATMYAIIRTAMQWSLSVLGFICVIGFVISGVLYLTAAGNDNQIKQAKNAMWYSILGVIVALSGYVVVNAVDTWLRAGINEGI